MTKAQSIYNPAVGDKPKKRLYSIVDAAEYLGRSVWGVREMVYAGKLPFIKDGRRILLDVRDMDLWIEKNKILNTY